MAVETVERFISFLWQDGFSAEPCIEKMKYALKYDVLRDDSVIQSNSLKAEIEQKDGKPKMFLLYSSTPRSGYEAKTFSGRLLQFDRLAEALSQVEEEIRDALKGGKKWQINIR